MSELSYLSRCKVYLSSRLSYLSSRCLTYRTSTLKGAKMFGITLDAGSPDYANLGAKTCYKQKSGGKQYFEGPNPYCGTKGLCCRLVNNLKVFFPLMAATVMRTQELCLIAAVTVTYG